MFRLEDELERSHREVFPVVMNVYLLRQFSLVYVQLFLDDHLLQKIAVILEQTEQKRINFSNIKSHTYIHTDRNNRYR